MKLTRLFVFSLLVLFSGCALNGSNRATEGVFQLPDMPRATRGLTTGEPISFQGVVFSLEDATYGADAQTVTIAARGDGLDVRETVPVGSYAYFGDMLARVTAREAVSQRGARAGVTLTLYHLPSLSQARAGEPGDTFVLRQGELRLIDGGFVALGEIIENAPERTDDDAAKISAGVDGRIFIATLREFQGDSQGLASMRLGNVWPDLQGGGSAEVAVVRGDSPWAGWRERELITATPGEPIEWRGLELDVTPLDQQGAGWRALIEASDPVRDGRAILVPGQSWRWGPWLIEAIGVGPGEASLALAWYEQELLPLDQRARSADAQSRPEGGSQFGEPTEVERELMVGNPLDVQGARFELRRTYANQLADPSDDVGEVAFRFGQTVRSARVQEGWKSTFSAGGQWWIVEVKEVDPYPLPEGGKARLNIRHGAYSGDAQDRRPIVGAARRP